MTASPPSSTLAALTFNASFNPSRFGPRLGKVTLSRPDNSLDIDIDTPGLTISTSRGVVPHLTRDHHRTTQPIRWVHIPFESFLEHTPPVPTLQAGKNPLHTFLGYPKQIVSMSLRDPCDNREMPPNGNDHVAAYCVRGVRKVTRSSWISYVFDCKPDVVVALSDTPFTRSPYSQKRLTKSIERSTVWLSDMLRPIVTSPSSEPDTVPCPHVLVQMAGGTSLAARAAFARGLTEILGGKEAEDMKPLNCLDDGVAGYVFDLVPLRSARLLNDHSTLANSCSALTLMPLLMASLASVSNHKLRLVNSANSPHEILLLVQHIGIDLFDAHWAQKAANNGVALDFRFPAPDQHHGSGINTSEDPKIRTNGKIDLGYNLYDSAYAHNFSMLFRGGFQNSASTPTNDSLSPLACQCAACSPTIPSTCISHSSTDSETISDSESETRTFKSELLPPFTRAYLHHLLQTHEMSAHSLLTVHNLEVLDAFFVGVRAILSSSNGDSRFTSEVQKFRAVYDEGISLFEEARVDWSKVEAARGKGRLARDRAKQAEADSHLS